ncbi:MAG: phage integrase N-terminal SAM-like domain-containing protein [Nitrospirota bacterium]|nr:phage integrase N-terminal SAM-like domain-containing protein [Nitrospirota bacterium]
MHKELFGRFRSEMRRRHYSLRTEKSYEEWIRRFLIFHALRPPHELGAAAVKEYLEYLAEERQVTASTQSQALLKAVSGQHSAFSQEKKKYERLYGFKRMGKSSCAHKTNLPIHCSIPA